jgi:hypothetical protein
MGTNKMRMDTFKTALNKYKRDMTITGGEEGLGGESVKARMEKDWGNDWKTKYLDEQGGVKQLYWDGEGGTRDTRDAPESVEDIRNQIAEEAAAPEDVSPSEQKNYDIWDELPEPTGMRPAPQFPTERVNAPGEMQLGYEQEDQVPLSQGYQMDKPTSSWLPEWLSNDIKDRQHKQMRARTNRRDARDAEPDQGFRLGPTTGDTMEKERFFSRRSMLPSAQPPSDQPDFGPAMEAPGLGEALAPKGRPLDSAKNLTGLNREQEQWDYAMEFEQSKRDVVADFFDEYGRLPSVGEMDDISKQIEYRTKGQFDDGMSFNFTRS